MYSESFKAKMVQRLSAPGGPSQNALAAEVGVPQATLSRWMQHRAPNSAISFVTPRDRQYGRDHEILANRRRVYEAARRRNPERWSRDARNWERVEVVRLNPELGPPSTTTSRTQHDR